jgi:dCTP deaminase
MILTGSAIKHAVDKGWIEIEPFNAAQLGPNSYDLRLSPVIKKFWKGKLLDAALPCVVDNIYVLDSSGLILMPGNLYLMSTVERTFTDKFVPCIEGRSSVGRLGINVHATAGFGDLGFNGTWTLEVSVIQPVKIYPNMRLCQVFFHTVMHGIQEPDKEEKFKKEHYKGKYQNQTTPRVSNIHLEKGEWGI